MVRGKFTLLNEKWKVFHLMHCSMNLHWIKRLVLQTWWCIGQHDEKINVLCCIWYSRCFHCSQIFQMYYLFCPFCLLPNASRISGNILQDLWNYEPYLRNILWSEDQVFHFRNIIFSKDNLIMWRLYQP